MAATEPLEARRHRPPIAGKQPIRGPRSPSARMAPAQQNDVGRHVTSGLDSQVAGRGQQEEPFIFVLCASASGAGADAAGNGQGLDEVGGERKWKGGFEG